ncbi:recombination regulator RecX [Clostridium sp. NSJ-49]|uniref:recombination regulator RecX n=1 Tax=Clostridium TaxID=1485 RepID=UPI00164CA847|nr:recombination regulator RecX [Clostridium sp. NSJ-49]MBC5626929.1 recombination regulator RecX [Clostridium sp. NSJ-49]MDU6341040.1 recombination regulator RecX [Clostridium sp.]
MDIITKIEIGKRNKERVNIYIDDEFAFSLSAEIVYKENLAPKQVIDVEKLTRLAREDEFMKCKSSALKIVERSYRTEKEIFNKLITKEYSKESINRTIEFLREYNLINDRNYVKMYVKDKLKSQGKNKIKYNLKRKGISDELIIEELSKIDDEDSKNGAIILAQKKYNELKRRESDQYKLSQKLYRFLISKGYNYDLASDVMKEVIKKDEY